VFVIANHFDAKLGDQSQDGRFQFPAQQYTYDFDGVSEVLDHILITKGIGTFTCQVVHVNAEFAHQVSDHDPQVVDIKP
jgi:predicted extracellular nuclease